MLNEEKSASGGENQNPDQLNPVQNQQTSPVSESHSTPALQGQALEGYRRRFPIPKIVFLGIIFLFLFAVIAVAYFLGKNSASQAPAVPTISQTPTPNLKANWRTYTGDGYSFLYPPESPPSANGNQVILDLSSNSVRITKESTALSLAQYIDQKSWCTSIKSTSGNQARLGTVTALRFDKTTCGPTGSTDVYAINNGAAYHIQIDTQENYDQISSLFDQILSTFKFTDSVDETADWKDPDDGDITKWETYKSELEGLNFKYPSTWKASKKIISTHEEFTLRTPSGFEFQFISGKRYRDGGCLNCIVNYVEKIHIPNFKSLSIVENNRGANYSVIYLSEDDVKVGDDLLNWFVKSKTDPINRDFVFQGEFYEKDGSHKTLKPDEFSNTPEVQTARKILRTVSY